MVYLYTDRGTFDLKHMESRKAGGDTLIAILHLKKTFRKEDKDNFWDSGMVSFAIYLMKNNFVDYVELLNV